MPFRVLALWESTLKGIKAGVRETVMACCRFIFRGGKTP
jgi:hypothetical protein